MYHTKNVKARHKKAPWMTCKEKTLTIQEVQKYAPSSTRRSRQSRSSRSPNIKEKFEKKLASNIDSLIFYGRTSSRDSFTGPGAAAQVWYVTLYVYYTVFAMWCTGDSFFGLKAEAGSNNATQRAHDDKSPNTQPSLHVLKQQRKRNFLQIRMLLLRKFDIC